MPNSYSYTAILGVTEIPDKWKNENLILVKRMKNMWMVNYLKVITH